jgi:hypothetical protein
MEPGWVRTDLGGPDARPTIGSVGIAMTQPLDRIPAMRAIVIITELLTWASYSDVKRFGFKL